MVLAAQINRVADYSATTAACPGEGHGLLLEGRRTRSIIDCPMRHLWPLPSPAFALLPHLSGRLCGPNAGLRFWACGVLHGELSGLGSRSERALRIFGRGAGGAGRTLRTDEYYRLSRGAGANWPGGRSGVRAD